MLVQGMLEQDPFSGHLFAFRGRKANLIKIVFWDGTGLCLFTKRLEQGRFATARLNDVEPYAYLSDVLRRMTDGHPVNRLDDLLPWNWTPTTVNP